MAQAARTRLLQEVDPGENSSELPSPGNRHWVPRHKAAVVAAVRDGSLSLAEACRRYMLTEEEFASWADALDQHGIAGLQTNMRGERRKAERQAIAEAGMALLQGANGTHCLITEISDQGARIQFEAPVSLPNTFELKCEGSGRSWWVTVIWNRGPVNGVRFCNPLSPPWTIKSGLGAWLLGKRHTVSIDRLDAR